MEFTREFIYRDIRKKFRKTKNGFYWYPMINSVLFAKGLINDNDYFYPRSMFANFLYWTDKELELFVAKKKLETDIANLCRIKNMFYSNNFDMITLELKDKVLPYSYTVEEVIDAFEYFNNN